MENVPTRSEKIINFVKYGAGLKVFSLFSNFIFYSILEIEISKAYFLVLTLDFIIAFLLNYFFVFKVKKASLAPLITKFLLAGLLFRIIDMKLYLATVKVIGHVYVSQIMVTVIIFVLKFLLYDKIFKSDKEV